MIMRGNKFRVWDRKDKTLKEVQEIRWDRDGRIIHLVLDNKDLTSDKITKYGISNVKMMQYTGLKDCEGQEIYEGDVVEVDTLAIEHYNKKVKGEIKKVDGCYTVEFFQPVYDVEKEINRNRLYLKCFTINRAAKIIGNKYENPELLEGVNNVS